MLVFFSWSCCIFAGLLLLVLLHLCHDNDDDDDDDQQAMVTYRFVDYAITADVLSVLIV
jgi:hypothetical protein